MTPRNLLFKTYLSTAMAKDLLNLLALTPFICPLPTFIDHMTCFKLLMQLRPICIYDLLVNGNCLKKNSRKDLLHLLVLGLRIIQNSIGFGPFSKYLRSLGTPITCCKYNLLLTLILRLTCQRRWPGVKLPQRPVASLCSGLG